MKVKAYAAFGKGQELKPYEFETGTLQPHEVLIRITHCGICHSDVHLIDNDWGTSVYPLVPGHEIVGIVSEIGDSVTHLKIGQRVGVGWQSGSCMQCEWCIGGDENLCPDEVDTCVGRPGGFAEAIRTDSRFAFPLPENLSSESAAPLLCAGITVYSPLRNLGVQASWRIGVVGVGGLGHLALQFARAFGCEVTAFSSHADKGSEAKKFGAHHFVHTQEAAQLTAMASTQDLIISTLNHTANWKEYINILRPKGILCVVGAAAEPMAVPAGMLITANKAIVGSNTGNRRTIREMLDFAARHGIRAQAEVLPFQKANEAVQKVRRGEARFRIVLSR